MAPKAVAQLPSGGPADKGIPLDDAVPNYRTFAKPEDDSGTSETPSEDESIFRVRGPRDLTKDRNRVDVIDQSEAGPNYMGLGEPENSPKTPYPYRDDKPNWHNASAEFVAGLWRLLTAPVRVLRALDGVRVASTSEEILTNLSPDFRERSRKCQSKLRRADIKNLRWIFSVDCGNGAKTVLLKARRSGNVTKFTKLDLELSCSCPAWQWLGPEHNAQQGEYLLGKPRGTASPPDIKDPKRVHKVCKHVAAVLAATKGWTIPKKK